jgi:hypothetical protein
VPPALIGLDEFQLAIPWRGGLHQSPPPLHQPGPVCGKLGSLVEDFSANGKVSLNWLSHPRGQVQPRIGYRIRCLGIRTSGHYLWCPHREHDFQLHLCPDGHWRTLTFRSYGCLLYDFRSTSPEAFTCTRCFQQTRDSTIYGRAEASHSGSHALIRHLLCSVLCSTRQLQFFPRRTAPGLLKECQHRRYLVVDLLHGSFRGAVDNCPVFQLLEGKAPGNKSIAQGLCSTADFHGAELLGRAILAVDRRRRPSCRQKNTDAARPNRRLRR